MTEHRIHNDDKIAIKELHQAFGPKFWERVIFVFTFANQEDCDTRDERDESGPEPPYHDKEAWKELIKKRFIHRIELRASSVKDFLKEIISIDGIGGFVPAGTQAKSQASLIQCIFLIEKIGCMTSLSCAIIKSKSNTDSQN